MVDIENVVNPENRDRLSDYVQISDHQGTKNYSFIATNFHHHLEIYWKWSISFIPKTVRDRANSGKYGYLDTKDYTVMASEKNLELSEFWPSP